MERLLDPIDLVKDKTIVTIDAAHVQRETAQYLKGTRGFDYVMTVKGNQPTLYTQVFDRCLPVLADPPHHVVEEKSRGRIKRWSIWTLPADGIDFPYASQLACIRRDVFTLDYVRIGKEYAFIITSRPAELAGPADLHHKVREHWGIENKSHYVRDTTWREDHHRAYRKQRAAQHGRPAKPGPGPVPPQRRHRDQSSHGAGQPRP